MKTISSLTCLIVVLHGTSACSEIWVVVVGWGEWRVYRGVLVNLVVPDTTPQVALYTSSH